MIDQHHDYTTNTRLPTGVLDALEGDAEPVDRAPHKLVAVGVAAVALEPVVQRAGVEGLSLAGEHNGK